MNCSGINQWKCFLKALAICNDSQEKKTYLSNAIQHAFSILKTLEVSEKKPFTNELLRIAKSLSPEDYTVVTECINALSQNSEAFESVSLRHELQQPNFWKGLKEKTAKVKGIIFQGLGEEKNFEVPIGIILQLLKDQPSPSCFYRSIHCQLGVSNDTELVELPEYQIRAFFPGFAPQAIDGSFQKTGSINCPLKLNISKAEYLLIKKYVETFPRPSLFDKSGEETAELLELLLYAGHTDLYEQLEIHLGVKRPGLQIKQDNQRHSLEKVIWYGNFYANSIEPQIRNQLENYFSAMLSQLVFCWKRQSIPPRKGFKSIEALKTGEKQFPFEEKSYSEPASKPDKFVKLLKIFNLIKLSRIVINFNGPKWFWEGIITLESLSTISFKNNQFLQNPHCQQALVALIQKQNLIIEIKDN
jgi:hypothetical protein